MPRAQRHCPGNNSTCPNLIRPGQSYCALSTSLSPGKDAPQGKAQPGPPEPSATNAYATPATNANSSTTDALAMPPMQTTSSTSHRPTPLGREPLAGNSKRRAHGATASRPEPKPPQQHAETPTDSGNTTEGGMEPPSRPPAGHRQGTAENAGRTQKRRVLGRRSGRLGAAHADVGGGSEWLRLNGARPAITR